MTVFFTVHLKTALKNESLLNLSWGEYKFNSDCPFSQYLWWLWRLRLILNLGTVKIQNCKFCVVYFYTLSLLSSSPRARNQPSESYQWAQQKKSNILFLSDHITTDRSEILSALTQLGTLNGAHQTCVGGRHRFFKAITTNVQDGHSCTWMRLYAPINSAANDNTTVISAALVTDKRRISVLQKWSIQCWMFAFSEAAEWTHRQSEVSLERVEWCAS